MLRDPRRIMAIVFLAVAGCHSGPATPTAESAQEKSAKDNVVAYNEATELLATVKDKETAEAARPKLLKCAERIKANYEQILKAPPRPAESTQPKVSEAVQQEAMIAMVKNEKEAERVAKVPGGADLIKDFRDALGQVGVKPAQ